jgi:hypothetical protein
MLGLIRITSAHLWHRLRCGILSASRTRAALWLFRITFCRSDPHVSRRLPPFLYQRHSGPCDSQHQTTELPHLTFAHFADTSTHSFFRCWYEDNNLRGFAIIFTVIFGLPLLVKNLSRSHLRSFYSHCRTGISAAVVVPSAPCPGESWPYRPADPRRASRLTTEEISERFKAMDQLPPFVSKKKTMTSPLGLSRVTPPQPLPQVPMTEQAPTRRHDRHRS